MASAQQDGRARRARSLRITGVIGLAAAVLFLFAAGLLPAVALAVLGVGNLLAARPMEETGAVPTPIRAMIVVGGLGFVVTIAILMITAVYNAP